ncbi:hypothetical protein ACFVSN_02035 [Kitasatospora sp. NPDC057904]|uniref:hypothetical protein n=1 Tax=unclassified Kitasatospora TaxID=2633591 RepID=UPI0036D7AAA9
MALLLPALIALTAGCSAAPSRSAATGSTATVGVPAAPSSSAATVGPAPAWRALGPLSGDQLTDVLLTAADLPPNSTTEPAKEATPAAGPDPMADAAQRYPACAPVLTAMSERPGASARRWYVTGNNVLGNRTLVDVGGFTGGRSKERFEALKAAVYGGGCTDVRVDDGRGGSVDLRVEPVPSDTPEVPAVGFRVLTPTAAVASSGGFTRVYLYAAVGDNRILFFTGDDTVHKPALRTDLVTAQIHRLTAAATGG